MGRTVLLILLTGCILTSPALSYQGPVQVVRFSEDETNELGFIREGAGHGPLRLLVSDTAIYLLDRLRHRLYTFDLSGKVLDSLDVNFCPGDMVYDKGGTFHFLQFRVQPQFVAAYKNGQETERREFELPVNRLMTEICFSPDGERLLLAGGFSYRMVPGEGKDVLYAFGERPGRFHLLDTHIGRVEDEDTWAAVLTGKTASGSITPVRLEPLGREFFQFHTDDRQGRFYIVGTSVQMDEAGEEYIARRLIVTKDGQEIAELGGLEPGHSSYDFANHDIAVAGNGDIYLWRTNFTDKYSEILRWRPVD